MTSFAKLMPNEKTSDINCGWGVEARMTYNPRQITAVIDEAEVQDDSDERRNQLAEQIAQIVTEWEMTGPVPIEDIPGHKVGSVVPEDEPVPIEKRVLSYLPAPLLTGILLGLQLDSSPDPKGMRKGSLKPGETPTSMRPSSATDTSSLSLNGSTTS